MGDRYTMLVHNLLAPVTNNTWRNVTICLNFASYYMPSFSPHDILLISQPLQPLAFSFFPLSLFLSCSSLIVGQFGFSRKCRNFFFHYFLTVLCLWNLFLWKVKRTFLLINVYFSIFFRNHDKYVFKARNSCFVLGIFSL